MRENKNFVFLAKRTKGDTFILNKIFIIIYGSMIKDRAISAVEIDGIENQSKSKVEI